MPSKTGNHHESEKIQAEIAKLMAETSRINAELSKLGLDSKKTEAETTKLYREILWYLVAIASGFVGAIAAITAIIIKLV